ncbi:hypothetical protein GCM10010174_76710 [Kutzneria viridogrisea]|uniref:TIR domain-containing protein n=2 Tax=Kutzneria TaxID=43356 RepID=A0ABR6BNL7_9PSEU|nr:hypothetical protein [Kutzneria albida]AHH96327.1 putative secreted protein [Kutzneria albida DSM 43870]MBA8928458.1 hypothetical protein [Kutzneria viridogrisea]
MRARWISFGLVLAVLAALSWVSMAAAPPVDRDNAIAPAALLATDQDVAGLLPVADQPAPHSPDQLGSDPARGYRCEDAMRTWNDGNPDHRFTVRVERCNPFGLAALHQLNVSNEFAARHFRVEQLPGIPYGVVGSGQVNGTWLSQILFRRGEFTVQVTVASSQRAGAPPSPTLRSLALLQWQRTPGTPGRPVKPVDSTAQLTEFSTASSLLAFGLILFVQLVGVLRNRRRGLRATSAAPADREELVWQDTGPRARKLARDARIRFWTTMIAFLVVFAVPLDPVVKGLAFAFLAYRLVLGRRYQPGSRRLWGRHAASQVSTGRNRRAAALWYCAAVGLLVLAIMDVFCVGVVLRLIGTDAIGPDLRWDPTVVADSTVLRPLRLMSVPVLVADLTVAAVLLALAMSACYRHARRLAALDTRERLRTDSRAPIIYLRNFADDEVTVRTSPLTRKSALDKVGLQQFEPFEEVLVRYLTSFGPVTAVNNPEQSRSPLGAARESLSHEDWQDTVKERIRASALIVVSAAPATITEGLSWELETIVSCAALDRTVFVLPPHPGAELPARWANFRAMAAHLDVPEAAEEHVDRLLLLRTDGSGRWTAWHADTRGDWAYAVGLSAAAEQIMA